MNIKKAVNMFSQLSWSTKIELLFYPIFLIWRMPIAWGKSLWEARILLNGQWNKYMGFHPVTAINNLFYKNQRINIEKFGLKGKSTLLGNGDYEMSSLFYIPLISHYIYSNAGAFTILVGTIAWMTSNLIWINDNFDTKIIAMVLILALSVVGYSMAFARQNYQILGLMLWPITLYFVQSENILAIVFLLTIMSVTSITAYLFMLAYTGLFAASSGNYEILYALLSSVILIVLKGIYLRLFNNKSLLIGILRIVGAATGAKYKRIKTRKAKVVNIYFSILYLIPYLGGFFLMDKNEPLLLIPFFFYFANENIIRIADIESLIVINTSIIFAIFAQSGIALSDLVIFWLICNPAPQLLSVTNNQKDNLEIRVFKPYDVTKLTDELEKFISICAYKKVLCAFEDPLWVYENLFKGKRQINEALKYAGLINNVNIFPDWYALVQVNSGEIDENIWVNTESEAYEVCKKHNCDYVIFFIDSNNISFEKKYHIESQLQIDKLIKADPALKEVVSEISDKKLVLIKRENLI